MPPPPDPAPGTTPPQALAAALRQLLAEQPSVTLPGLGTIRKVHSPARIEMDEDGRRVLLPPRVALAFDPEG